MQVTPSIEQQVLTERLQMLKEVWIKQLLGIFAGATTLLLALGDHIGFDRIVPWYVTLVVICMCAGYVPYLVKDMSSVTAARCLCATSFVIALVWTYCTVFMFPSLIEYQLILFLIQGGMLNGASLTNTLPAQFYLLFITSIVPLTVMFALENTAIHWLVVGCAVVYILMMIATVSQFPRSVRRVIELHLANTKLLSEVTSQKSKAEAANRAKSQFLAAASHDLRQPLYALGLFSAALEQATEQSETRLLITKIQASSKALEELLNALLDISKLDAGIIEANMTSVPVDTIVTRLVSEFGAEAELKGLHLSRGTAGVGIRTDATMFESILRNLLANAIHYTPQGSVEIAFKRDADTLHIQILDTGIGIPEEKIDDVFQEFYQLGNQERDRTKGLGLGLAIVRRLVEILGHTVSVNARPSGGTCFTVSVTATALPTASPDPTMPVSAMGADLTDLRVLVVDDEADIRAGMEILLKQWGCVAYFAGTLAEAHHALAQMHGDIDALIVDYRLRDCLGTELVEQLRDRLRARTPALIATGDTGVQELRSLSRDGYAMVHKPVPPARLRAFLGSIARGSSVSP